MTGELAVVAPDGAPEIVAGTDLAALACSLMDLRDGDVLVVTSKAVAKAEGRATAQARDAVVAAETQRVVARRGGLTIARHRLGLTLAAAGVDDSNVAAGHVVPLPEDPDASARMLRADVRERAGANVGVVVTDTAGRPWRRGQTDLAVGAAGIVVLESYVGRADGYGQVLAVTEPAVADEVAGAAELAQGKLGRRPFARVRGREDLVLPPAEDGPGASTLIRPEADDLFGFGAREAVVRALTGAAQDRPGFGSPASAEELTQVLAGLLSRVSVRPIDGGLRVAGEARTVAAIAFAHGWTAQRESGDLHTIRPASP